MLFRGVDMTRRRLLHVLGPSLILALLGCSRPSPSKGQAPGQAPGHSPDDLRKLTVFEVAERIDQPGAKVAVYDCNSKEQLVGAHLPRAQWLNFHEVKPADFPADKSTALVFYCYNEA
jgi:hypothetical protein